MSAYLTVRTLPLALAGFSCYRAGCVRGSPPCHREGAIAKLMAHSVRAQSTAHEREVPHLQGFSSTATGLRSGLARRTPCPAPGVRGTCQTALLDSGAHATYPSASTAAM